MIRKNHITGALLFGVSAISIGLEIATIAPIFSMIIAIAILFLAIISSSIFYLLKRKTKSKTSFIPLLIPVNILVGIILGIFFLDIFSDYKKDKATLFISKLEKFRSSKGHYPEKIEAKELNAYFIDEYNIDSTLQHFEIIQGYDGWSFYTYNTKNQQWKLED